MGFSCDEVRPTVTIGRITSRKGMLEVYTMVCRAVFVWPDLGRLSGESLWLSELCVSLASKGTNKLYDY